MPDDRYSAPCAGEIRTSPWRGTYGVGVRIQPVNLPCIKLINLKTDVSWKIIKHAQSPAALSGGSAYNRLRSSACFSKMPLRAPGKVIICVIPCKKRADGTQVMTGFCQLRRTHVCVPGGHTQSICLAARSTEGARRCQGVTTHQDSAFNRCFTGLSAVVGGRPTTPRLVLAGVGTRDGIPSQ